MKRVILVGASTAYFPEREAVLLRENVNSSSDRVGLFDRVRRMEGTRQQAQDHFLSQFQALLGDTDLANLISKGELQVDGLFYRAESGVFTYYDKQTESFALVS